jgi:hypothetical protein
VVVRQDEHIVARVAEKMDSPAHRRRRSFRRRIAAAAVVVVALLAAAYAAAFNGMDTGGETHDSGIRGTVVRVPLFQAAGPGAAAPVDGEPTAAVIRIENAQGRRIATVTSDDSGRFTADLPPGDYLVSAMSPVETALPVSLPFGISVRDHHYTEVRLVLPAATGASTTGSPQASP